ncbi:MAG TPA: multidrug effflux MFS transporter [Rhodopila sp.]|uniref:multidrug effflux MFS transporter n=1 Tax=Rhodopila sp. TaxID=2480087 RepID=UPI002CC925D3|nr:multidrug effflux MFS transporter [Rhodopila sp.]HVY17986.1 multidrug effflux MFS transporter [Rhodopila sp.]
MSVPSRYPSWLPTLLGLFIAVGPAATDMYLPAFPAVEASFGTEPGTAQLTLASWFAGLAVGQISQGTLSDRFGRRIPLAAGFALFTLSTIGCALAPTLGSLAVLRAIAAFGASAGMVIARAVVRDLTEGQAAAIMLSRLVLVMGVAPVLAPSIGGLILAFAHWRVIFWILTLYGATCVFAAVRVLPETLPEERRLRLSIHGQAQRYWSILRERTFLMHAIMGGCSTFCMFSYLSGSSPVFELGFGLSPSEFALVFGLCAVALVCGSQINVRLLPRLGLNRMLTIIAWTSLLSTAFLCVVAFAGIHSLPLVIAPLVVSIGCQGFANANSNAGALTRHAHHAGSAAALMGTFQFSLGASAGLLVSLLTDGTPRGMAAMMFCGMLGAVIADRFRPNPEPRQAAE